MIRMKNQKKSHNRIFAMGKERVMVLNNSLSQPGFSLHDGVRMIKREWQLYPEVSDAAMLMQLSRYKRDHIVTISAAEVEFKNKDKVFEKLHVLDEMVHVIHTQKTRVERFVTNEKKAPFPMSGVNKEIVTLVEMLKDAQKMQFDLGIDEYKGPLGPGKMLTQTVNTTAEGTQITTQLIEAVQVAKQVLQKRGVPEEPFTIDHVGSS
jgi:hypothetical protein